MTVADRDCATGCGRPAPQTFLCGHCARLLHDTLDDLPALVADLETTAAKQDQTTRGDTSGKGHDAPLNFAWDAADLIWSARNTISTWQRHIVEERGIDRINPGHPLIGPWCTVCDHETCVEQRRHLVKVRLARVPTHFAAACSWIALQVDWIAGMQGAEQLYDEITSIPRFANRAVDITGDRFAGRCTWIVEVATEYQLTLADQTHVTVLRAEQTDTRICNAELRIRAGSQIIRCRECGAQYDAVEKMRANLELAREHQAHAKLIADALTDAGHTVTRHRIYMWAQRGKLFSYRDDQGRPLYRVGDVLDLLAKYTNDRRERVAVPASRQGSRRARTARESPGGP